ncbi:MAG: DoxX family membrane protein [Acidimicrobiia bacterium]|nr:DoxX family membrane protein [Acidimicrobiia bacterium]
MSVTIDHARKAPVRERPARVVERVATEDRTDRAAVAPYVWAVTRIALAWVFLWAFVDKLFGLGRATPEANAWIDGGSPTTGFLKGVKGPFGDMFNNLAGAAWADWLFMVGLAAIGLALLLGIGMRVAAVSGAAMMVLMWMASLPLANNHVVDDHIVYALVLVGLALTHAGDTVGLGRWWARTPLVRRVPALR